MKVKRIRKFKYRVLKYKIHRFLPTKKLMFFGHLGGLSTWVDRHKDGLKFSDFPNKTFDYNKRLKLYDFLIETEIGDNPVDFLEFGVAKGGSFKWWLEHLKHEDSHFFGFDTFDGLPEDWGPFKKGDMSNGDKPPVFDDQRYSFYQGVFQNTLFDFLKTYKSNKRKVIHMDADLYTATLFVLTTIHPYLNKGDIILFDEFNVPMHEYKAFMEWTEAFYVNYKVLGQVNNFYQIALVIS